MDRLNRLINFAENKLNQKPLKIIVKNSITNKSYETDVDDLENNKNLQFVKVISGNSVKDIDRIMRIYDSEELEPEEISQDSVQANPEAKAQNNIQSKPEEVFFKW